MIMRPSAVSGDPPRIYVFGLGAIIFIILRTIKLLTKLEKGRLFKENTEAIVWVTNNALHIPVKLEIPILVGSIYEMTRLDYCVAYRQDILKPTHRSAVS